MPKTRTATIKVAHSYLTQPDTDQKTSLHRYLQQNFAYHGASIRNREILWQQLQKESLRRAQISQSNGYQESIRSLRYGIAGETLEKTSSIDSDKRIIWYLTRLGELCQESIQNLPKLFARFEEDASLFDTILEQLKLLKSNNCILGCLELIRIDIQRMPYRHSKISQNCLETINQYYVRGILPQNAWGHWFREIYEQDPDFDFSKLKSKIHFDISFFQELFPTTYQPQHSSWYDFVLKILEQVDRPEIRCKGYLYVYFLVPTEYQAIIENKIQNLIRDGNKETPYIQKAVQSQYQALQWCIKYQIPMETIPPYKLHTDIKEQNILAWIQLYKIFEDHKGNDKTWTKLITYIINNKEDLFNEKCINLVTEIVLYGIEQGFELNQATGILEEYLASLRPYVHHLEITQLEITLSFLYKAQGHHDNYEKAALSIDTSTSKRFKEEQTTQIFDQMAYEQKRDSILARTSYLHMRQNWDSLKETFQSISEDYLKEEMLSYLFSCMKKRGHVLEGNVHTLFSMVNTLPTKQKEKWYRESILFLSSQPWIEILSENTELIDNPTYHALYTFFLAHQYKKESNNQWKEYFDAAWKSLLKQPFDTQKIVFHLTQFGIHDIKEQIIIYSLSTTRHQSSDQIHDDILSRLAQTALQKNHIDIAIRAAGKIQNPEYIYHQTVDFFSAQATEFGWSLLKQQFHHERWLASYPYFYQNYSHDFTELLTKTMEQTTSKIEEIENALQHIVWEYARDAFMHFHDQMDIQLEIQAILFAYQKQYQKSNKSLSKIAIHEKRVKGLIKILQVAMLHANHDVARSIIQQLTPKELRHLFTTQSWSSFHTLFHIYIQLEPLPQSISFLDEISTSLLDHMKSTSLNTNTSFLIFSGISRLYQRLQEPEKSKVWEERAQSCTEKEPKQNDTNECVQMIRKLLQSRNDHECRKFLKDLPKEQLRSSLLLLPQEMKEIMFGVHIFILAHYKENKEMAVQLLQHPKLVHLRTILAHSNT